VIKLDKRLKHKKKKPQINTGDKRKMINGKEKKEKEGRRKNDLMQISEFTFIYNNFHLNR